MEAVALAGSVAQGPGAVAAVGAEKGAAETGAVHHPYRPIPLRSLTAA
jgi:hypothetical protein